MSSGRSRRLRKFLTTTPLHNENSINCLTNWIVQVGSERNIHRKEGAGEEALFDEDVSLTRSREIALVCGYFGTRKIAIVSPKGNPI